MRVFDVFKFTFHSLAFSKLRTSLMLLAMAVGVGSVLILTALGEGARVYVSDQFSSMGSNLLIIIPGKKETSGFNPSTFIGSTPRDLTVEDAKALKRSGLLKDVAPVIVGAVPVSRANLEREVAIFGSTADLNQVLTIKLKQGKFLPHTASDIASPVCIIGANVKKELFKNENALGQWLRIGDRRFRVIGILADEGRSLGMNMNETVIIPVVAAQAVFNTSSLFRILVTAKNQEHLLKAKQRVISIIKQRHQNEEDITVITQDAVVATFDNILKSLTYAVAGIASISLAVAGILIMNVMLISVSQRTAEIGLFKAVGSPPNQIKTLFLTEAVFLSLFGALSGIILGHLGNFAISNAFTEIAFVAPWWANFAAIMVAMVTGIVFGLMPASRAAKLDPVQALYGN